MCVMPNIAGRCHSLQSVEIPCLTLVQSSLQHEDQSVSMNGLETLLVHVHISLTCDLIKS
jgi:hypothetical protein